MEKDDTEFRVRVPNGRKVSFHVDVKEGSRVKFRVSVDRKDVKLTAIFQMDVSKTLMAIRDASLSSEKRNKATLTSLRSQLETLSTSNKELESSLIQERAQSKVEIKDRKDEIERLNNVICEMAENEKKRRDEHEDVTSGLKRMLDKIKQTHESEIVKLSDGHKETLRDSVSDLKNKLSSAQTEKIEALETQSREHEVIVETLKKSQSQLVEKLRQDHELVIERLKKTHEQEVEKLRDDYESRMKDLDARVHDLYVVLFFFRIHISSSSSTTTQIHKT